MQLSLLKSKGEVRYKTDLNDCKVLESTTVTVSHISLEVINSHH